MKRAFVPLLLAASITMCGCPTDVVAPYDNEEEEKKQEAETKARGTLAIRITAEGAVVARGRIHTPESLAGVVASRLRRDPNARFRLRIHPKAPSSIELKVLDILAQEGADRVVIVGNDAEPESPPTENP